MKKLMGILLVLTMCMSVASASAAAFNAGHEITVISREDGSGTRGAFVELFGVEEKNAAGEKVDMTTEEAIITNSTSVCMTSVAGNQYAIGYISLGSLNDTVKALKINGVTPSVEAIQSGEYTVARPFNIATGETASDLAKDFISYVLSADGQVIVAGNGYIPVAADASAPYVGTALAGKLVIGGSSSVTPVMEKLTEGYAAVNPNANIEVQQSDSTSGMNGVRDGVLDIGMASRDLKESELEAGLQPTVIARDGIAVIVNLLNPLEDATPDMIKAVYTGEITNWNELGE